MGDCATRNQARTKLGLATITNGGGEEYITKQQVIDLGADPTPLTKYIGSNELVDINDIKQKISGTTFRITTSVIGDYIKNLYVEIEYTIQVNYRVYNDLGNFNIISETLTVFTHAVGSHNGTDYVAIRTVTMQLKNIITREAESYTEIRIIKCVVKLDGTQEVLMFDPFIVYGEMNRELEQLAISTDQFTKDDYVVFYPELVDFDYGIKFTGYLY